MRRGRQPEEDISRARIMVSPRFLYQASLMEKRYLAMQIRSCEDKLKGKTAHFRLPSASQKRAYLSSLLCLRLLQTAQGSLLDDEQLVNTLNSSKTTSQEVAEQLQVSEQTEIKIDAAREVIALFQ